MDYIFKDVNNNLYMYTFSNNDIIRKKYKNERWFYEETIIREVRDNFTFSIDKWDNIYIFCQSLDYKIIMVKGYDNSFQSEIILEQNDKKTVKFHPIIDESGLILLYSTPFDNNGKSHIYMQKFNNNIWSKAELVDSFVPFKHCYFDVYRDKIFYQSIDNAKHICYRDIKGTIGNKVKYHSTNYDILDLSNIIIENEIYMSYIIKSAFSYQLFFRKVGYENIEPIVITEGQNLDNVVIFNSDKLYIFFSSRDGIYYVTSVDGGQSFSKVKKYKEDMGVCKAKFVSNCLFNMSCNDIYVSKNEPKSIKVINDIYSDFYNDYQKPVTVSRREVVREKIENNLYEQSKHNINEQQRVQMPVENKGIYYENLADLKNEDFYRVLLEKKRQKEEMKKREKFESLNTFEDLNNSDYEKIKRENEQLKKALMKFMK